jgi:hypothetical protein
MLHTSTESVPVRPLIFSAQPGDPPPPDEEGDSLTGDLGGKIKPPTVNQTDSSDVAIKPPTAIDEAEGPIDIPGGP